MKMIGMKALLPKITLPSIDPDQFIGYTFIAEYGGTTEKDEVTQKNLAIHTMLNMLMEMMII